MGETKKRLRLAMLLAVPFAVLMLLVSPRGDFPLNDDWVYAKMVRNLVDDHRFGLSPLSNAFAITQTVYAAPLVYLFGFSFTLLRLTTLFMAYVTVCAVAFTARELRMSNATALVAALTVLVSPLFVNLSYTFMTDVPFCAFAAISMYYFVKALRTPRTRYLLLGTLFAIAAFYNRQLGVLIPIAFALTVGAYWAKARSHVTWLNLVALFLPWVVAGMGIFLLQSDSERVFADAPATLGMSGLLIRFVIGILSATFYIGLLQAPIGYALLVKSLSRRSDWSARRFFMVGLLSGVFSGASLTWLVIQNNDGVFPILRLVKDVGVGPAAFSFLRPSPNTDSWMPVQITFNLPFVAQLALCLLCCLPGTAVGIAFPKLFVNRSTVPSAQHLFLSISAAMMLIAPAIASPGPYFDRYYVAAFPFLTLLAAGLLEHCQKRRRAQTYALVVSLLVFALSVISVQDYMAWNTARWKAIAIARATYSATDNQINAGFEFNGMYTSDEYLARVRESADSGVDHDARQVSPMWVTGEDFLVSPVQLPADFRNKRLLERVPYFSWLGFATRYIYLYGPK